ncbi:hypothetical protein D3C86_1731840 [compost metagenome]
MPLSDMEDEYDPSQSVMLTGVMDTKKMVTWLRLRNEVDPDRIGVFGISRVARFPTKGYRRQSFTVYHNWQNFIFLGKKHRLTPFSY